MTDRLNPEALEAACAGFYNDPMGLTNWHKLCSADPALADKYRAGMNAAVSAYLAALPAPRTITTVEELEALPVGSVIADLYDDRGDAPIVLCKANNGEWAALTTGTRMGIPWWASRDIAHVARRLRVLHVPTEGGGES